MFSYGSGLAASMFTIRVANTAAAKEQLTKCATIADLSARLAARTKVTPEVFNKTMAAREGLHQIESAWEPATASIAHLLPGTHYLTRRDAMGRRFYDIASSSSSSTTAAPSS
jgi:3-hydroxy-3-methylglutaryl CoA synthase